MAVVLIAIGGLVLLLGVLGFIFSKMKGGRIAQTPFHKTGDVAAKGDSIAGDKGSISTEGKFIAPAELLTSPVDAKPCLMYTLTVTAKWKAGDNEVSVEMMKEEKSINFQIDDGSGPVTVNPGTSGDFTPMHKFSETKGKGLKAAFSGGGIQFGATNFEVHPGGRYNGKLVPDNAKISVVETALEPQASFYVNGKWKDGVIQKHDWTSLILSSSSRDETLATTLKYQKNGKIAAGVGGGLAVIGVIMQLVMGSPAKEGPASEKTKTEAVQEKPADAPAKADSHKKAAPAEKPADKPAEKPAEAAPAPAGDAAPAEAGGAPGLGGKGGKRKR